MFWETKNEITIQELEKSILEHKNRMQEITQKIDLLIATKPDHLTVEEKARIADLEVKMAKLWSLLVEQTPLGKDKLSKFGRRFGGQARSKL
jgi:hypothetical protein